MSYKTSLIKTKKNMGGNAVMIFSAFACAFLVFVDQLIKNWVVNNIKSEENFIFIPKIMQLTYIKNYGAAFSMFFKKTKFLIIFAILSVAFLIFYILKNKIKNKVYIFSASMIISGGIGNLIDRVVKGYVVDYINLIFWPFTHFTIFNLADCLIVFGSLFFLIKFIKDDLLKNRTKKIGKYKF